ncbi:Neuronal calcium sensor 1 [Boothiomyces macroporosus]|uniref:Calcium-binding protein NCS-1 n=1 Tax=Boothiomyces macroporosus TaxID=261099 RepID=A0AAD5UQD3_9FUNG|nr:Neuronal calcium sensor 1 [Boothiomyces macroporosus]
MRDCPKGYISKQEFSAIYKNYFPFGDSTKYASMIFQLIDIDQNNEIDFEEFIQALNVSAKGTVEERLEVSFKLFDLDEDDRISPAEMLAVVDSIYRMVGPTQVLSEDEDTPNKRVEKVFRLMDKDHDGFLSKQEFLDGARNDPMIMNSLNLYAGMV